MAAFSWRRIIKVAASIAVFCQSSMVVADDNPATDLPLPHEETIEGNQFSARCEGGGGLPALRVFVHEFRDDKGNVRLQLYNDDPDAFLAKGTKLLRIEIPAPREGEPAQICVPLETAGVYALFVMHDRDQDGEADIFSEGFGVSNNPKMKFRKPRHKEAAFEVGDEVLDININLQYFGRSNRSPRRRR